MRMAGLSVWEYHAVFLKLVSQFTWRSERKQEGAGPVVNRVLSEAPVRDRLWVADITYVPTQCGLRSISRWS